MSQVPSNYALLKQAALDPYMERKRLAKKSNANALLGEDDVRGAPTPLQQREDYNWNATSSDPTAPAMLKKNPPESTPAMLRVNRMGLGDVGIGAQMTPELLRASRMSLSDVANSNKSSPIPVHIAARYGGFDGITSNEPPQSSTPDILRTPKMSLSDILDRAYAQYEAGNVTPGMLARDMGSSPQPVDGNSVKIAPNLFKNPVVTPPATNASMGVGPWSNTTGQMNSRAAQKFAPKPTSILGEQNYGHDFTSPSQFNGPNAVLQNNQPASSRGMAESLGVRSAGPDVVAPAGQPDIGLMQARAQRLNELYNSATENNRKAQIYNSYNAGKGESRSLTPQADIQSYKAELDQINGYLNKTGQAKELAARQQISPETRAAKAAALDVQALKNVTTANQTGNGMETDPALIAKLQSRLANPYAPPPDATNYAGRIAGLGANAQADVGLADKTQSDRVTSMKLRDEMKAGVGKLAQAQLDTAIKKTQAEGVSADSTVENLGKQTEAAKAIANLRKTDSNIKLDESGLLDPGAQQAVVDAGHKAIDAAVSIVNPTGGTAGLQAFNDEVYPQLKAWADADPKGAAQHIRGMVSKLNQEQYTFGDMAAQASGGLDVFAPGGGTALTGLYRASLARRNAIIQKLQSLLK